MPIGVARRAGVAVQLHFVAKEAERITAELARRPPTGSS
jgi:hypothetical protein